MFSLSEGLGFNTNVLETNILNLAVVIAVVVVYGGELISSILDERRARILKRVETADEKYNAAQEALRKAQQRLNEAKERAETIRSEGSATVQQAIAFVAKQADDELARLTDVKNSTFALAEQKATKEIQTNLVTRALAKAGTKLSGRLASQTTQKAFVDLQIKTLRTKA
jgi:F-type H+-transporting ATPase subunit b